MKIFHNAVIHTLDRSLPQATSIAINEGRILAVGGEDLAGNGSDAEVIDMGGKVILPGLVDAHIHLLEYATNLRKVNCETSSKAECLRRVEERCQKAAPGEWVLGHGWNQNEWDGKWPSAAELDAVSPRNPVYLTAKSLHAGWANSIAIRRAKFKRYKDTASEGLTLRDARGKPSGIFLETAVKPIEAAIPEPIPEMTAGYIYQVIQGLLQMGITGVHDFDKATCFRALQLLKKDGDLQFRVTKTIPRDDLDTLLRFKLAGGSGDDFLRMGPVKLFADGALGPRTAAMVEPYVGESENRGILLMTAQDIFDFGCRAAEGKFSLAVHAIGDRANREVLDGFARLREYEREKGLPALRHRIEHVQVIHPDDAGRLAELKLVASMQPLHMVSDMNMADRYWGERASLSYAWQTQNTSGAVLAFGSDAPVDSPNPFLGLHAAVTRRGVDGTPGPEGWYPQERLTFEQALAGYTLGPAYAAGMEDRLGKLAPGYLADLIVLEEDPFTCDPDRLAALEPVATMVDGEWVWEK